jgi:hypothetical protein
MIGGHKGIRAVTGSISQLEDKLFAVKTHQEGI